MAARAAHLGRLAEIERAAGALFPTEDLGPGMADETVTTGELARARAEGRLWVAETTEGRAVGFALADFVDDGIHLDEIDVHPEHARRGLGAALVERVRAWAAARGAPRLTLTTFRHLPWNAPFYARLGFETLEEGALSPELAAILREEVARGLDPRRRVAMALRLDRRGGGR